MLTLSLSPLNNWKACFHFGDNLKLWTLSGTMDSWKSFMSPWPHIGARAVQGRVIGIKKWVGPLIKINNYVCVTFNYNTLYDSNNNCIRGRVENINFKMPPLSYLVTLSRLCDLPPLRHSWIRPCIGGTRTGKVLCFMDNQP